MKKEFLNIVLFITAIAFNTNAQTYPENGYHGSYDLWLLHYKYTKNVNGDKFLWIFPINDDVYYNQSFQAGDTIRYNQNNNSQYHILWDTPYEGYLTYDERDLNGDGIISDDELDSWWDAVYFVKQAVQVEDSIPYLCLISTCYALFAIARKKRQQKNNKHQHTLS